MTNPGPVQKRFKLLQSHFNERTRRLWAAAEAQAKQAKAAAESEAASLRSEASRLEAELPELRAAAAREQKWADNKAFVMKQLPGYRTRAAESWRLRFQPFTRS